MQVIDITCNIDGRCLESNFMLRNLGFNDFKYLAPSIISKDDLAKFVDEFYVGTLTHSKDKIPEQIYLKVVHTRNNIDSDGIFISINSIDNISELWRVYNVLEKRLYRVNPTSGDFEILEESRWEHGEEILPGIAFAAPRDEVTINLRGRFSFLYTRNYNRVVVYVFDGDMLQKVLESCR